MDEESEFVWTFPCYILARNYTLDPNTGKLNLDENLRFIAPEAWPGGPRVVAVFTDSDWAEQFRRESSLRSEVNPVEFKDAEQLIAFLEVAKLDYQAVAVDPNRQTGRSYHPLIEQAIRELSDPRHLLEGPDSQ